MTACRHTGPVIIIEHCRGQRIHYPERALPVETLCAGPANAVQARCEGCGHQVLRSEGDRLPAWAQKAWRRARG